MTFDPTFSVGTVVNILLFVGAIIAIFTRRDKDMEVIKGILRSHSGTILEMNKLLDRLTASHCKLAEAHAKLEGIVEQMREKD